MMVLIESYDCAGQNFALNKFIRIFSCGLSQNPIFQSQWIGWDFQNLHYSNTLTGAVILGLPKVCLKWYIFVEKCQI